MTHNSYYHYKLSTYQAQTCKKKEKKKIRLITMTGMSFNRYNLISVYQMKCSEKKKKK